MREGADEETKLHILWRKLPMKSTSSSEVFFNPYTARCVRTCICSLHVPRFTCAMAYGQDARECFQLAIIT